MGVLDPEVVVGEGYVKGIQIKGRWDECRQRGMLGGCGFDLGKSEKREDEGGAMDLGGADLRVRVLAVDVTSLTSLSLWDGLSQRRSGSAGTLLWTGEQTLELFCRIRNSQ